MPTVTIAPPALSPRVQSVAELTGQWVVVRVLFQHEKALARDLARTGIGYLLPMGTDTKPLAGKTRKLIVPVYPGYLFACPDDAGQRYAVLDHPSVINHIDIPKRAQESFAREMVDREKDWRGNPLLAKTDWLQTGTRCVVKQNHHLRGMEGWTDSTRTKGAVTILVTILGGSRPISIDPAFLEPLN